MDPPVEPLDRSTRVDRHGLRAIALGLAAGVWAGACGDAGDSPREAPAHGEAPSAVEIRDSAGVRIVTVHRVSPTTPHWRVPDEPALELGAREEGDPALLFQRPAFAARLGDGTVVVADFGSAQLRFFDADGRHRNSVGGRGQGPGEFQEFNRVVRTAGTRSSSTTSGTAGSPGSRRTGRASTTPR